MNYTFTSPLSPLHYKSRTLILRWFIVLMWNLFASLCTDLCLMQCLISTIDLHRTIIPLSQWRQTLMRTHSRLEGLEGSNFYHWWSLIETSSVMMCCWYDYTLLNTFSCLFLGTSRLHRRFLDLFARPKELPRIWLLTDSMNHKHT